MSFLKRFQVSLESLHTPTDIACYVVAYSGGMDSHVLLTCCNQLRLPVRAVHVHHGLQSVADEWVVHCQGICKALDIRLDILYIDARKKHRQSPEEAARDARYQALQDNMRENEVLLTAQHRNDQAETLLLQLFRTASSAGLSAMPASRRFGRFVHLRPLLAFSRKEIESFARENALHWIEDPTNLDTSFDRNYVRQHLIPELENRWPNITEQLATVAGLQSGNLQVLEDMAAIDLANAKRTPEHSIEFGGHQVISILSISCLKQLSYARRFNLLRYWLLQEIPVNNVAGQLTKVSPTRKLLEEIVRSLIDSRSDANPVIFSTGYEFRKFQGELYLLTTGPEIMGQVTLDWCPVQPVSIPALNVQLRAVKTKGNGLNRELLAESLKIRFRQGGERLHPAGRRHSQSLKKLFQEAGIPQWQRDNIPLLYYGDELIAVIGLWICARYAVDKNGEGWQIEVEKL